MAAQYKTIQELLQAIASGVVDETDLRVIMDNDSSAIYSIADMDAELDVDPYFRGNGYYDVEELWPLVLPKATVEWC